jgi:hypothetical protein
MNVLNLNVYKYLKYFFYVIHIHIVHVFENWLLK